MLLPPIDSLEWRTEIDLFLSSDLLWREIRASSLGYPNAGAYRRAMRDRGVKLSERALPPAEDTKVETGRNPTVELPPIHLLPYKASKKRGDEEVAVLLATDGHAGKITKSYGDGVYRSRMGTMFESVMTIINLHRHMYPIRKLIIFAPGDNIQGENPYQGSVIGDVSMGARDQVVKLAAPMWNDVLGSFKQQFEEIEFHGLPGNHGHDKLSPATSSYDLLLYDVLQAGIGQQKGINIHVHDDWYAIVDIFGWKHFVFHGDGIPCVQGIPYFALDKKLKSWHMQLGGFSYAWSGHFHKRDCGNEVSSVLEHFMGSTLVSDDDWALKKMGISSNPSAFICGFHPRHGVTWRYPVIVDYNFIPHPLKGDSEALK